MWEKLLPKKAPLLICLFSLGLTEQLSAAASAAAAWCAHMGYDAAGQVIPNGGKNWEMDGLLRKESRE